MTDLQRTDEWRAARLGRATGSRISDIIAQTKSGYSTSRANYAAELIAERLTGVAQESYQSSAMKWGIDCEPQAVAAYEFLHDVTTDAVGFVEHPTIPMSGASPDRTIGEHGLVEVKCPLVATHIETLLNRKVPAKYLHQMQWQLACTNRQWCDYVSFDPRLPPRMSLFVMRIERSDLGIEMLEREVKAFLAEVDDTFNKLSALYAEAA